MSEEQNCDNQSAISSALISALSETISNVSSTMSDMYTKVEENLNETVVSMNKMNSVMQKLILSSFTINVMVVHHPLRLIIKISTKLFPIRKSQLRIRTKEKDLLLSYNDIELTNIEIPVDISINSSIVFKIFIITNKTKPSLINLQLELSDLEYNKPVINNFDIELYSMFLINFSPVTEAERDSKYESIVINQCLLCDLFNLSVMDEIPTIFKGMFNYQEIVIFVSKDSTRNVLLEIHGDEEATKKLKGELIHLNNSVIDRNLIY